MCFYRRPLFSVYYGALNKSPNTCRRVVLRRGGSACSLEIESKTLTIQPHRKVTVGFCYPVNGTSIQHNTLGIPPIMADGRLRLTFPDFRCHQRPDTTLSRACLF